MYKILMRMSKESHKKAMQKWIKKNPNYGKNYYQTHKELWNKNTQKYTVPQYAKKLRQQKSHYNHIKFEMLEFLSGNPPCCIKCGFKDVRALQFDHIPTLRTHLSE